MVARIIKGKRGWLRIVEAFIAVLLLAGFLLFLYVKSDSGSSSEEIYKIEREILEAIERNDNLRSEVLSGRLIETNSFVRENLPLSLDFELIICEIDENCGLTNPQVLEGKIYVDEILISSKLTVYNPKKLRFFVWEK